MSHILASALRNLYIPTISVAVLYAVFSTSALLALPVVSAIYLLLVLLDSRASYRIKRERDSEYISSAMLLLHSAIAARLPMAGAVSHLLDRIKETHSPAHGLFSRLYARLLHGQQIDYAISSESTRMVGNADAVHAMESVGMEYSSSSEVRHSLLQGHERIAAGIALKRERASASMARYLILSMVFSTVVPSLLLFGFISYSIIAYSSIGFLVFSITILSLMPSVIDAIGVKINEASQ